MQCQTSITLSKWLSHYSTDLVSRHLWVCSNTKAHGAPASFPQERCEQHCLAFEMLPLDSHDLKKKNKTENFWMWPLHLENITRSFEYFCYLSIRLLPVVGVTIITTSLSLQYLMNKYSKTCLGDATRERAEIWSRPTFWSRLKSHKLTAAVSFAHSSGQ